jgi:hypothetical protein
MIETFLFSFCYPAHAAALRESQGLLVDGIGSSLNNLEQGTFRDTQPVSALSSLWGKLAVREELPIPYLFRSEPPTPAAQTVGAYGVGGYCRPTTGAKGGSLQFSGNDEITRPGGVQPETRYDVPSIGVPTLPGTKPGADTFDALVHAMADVGLAANPDSAEPVLSETVWLKAPGTVSGPIDSLDSLRHVYYQLVIDGVATQVTVEKYVPGAVIVEVDVSGGEAASGIQVVGLQLKKRPESAAEKTSLEITDLLAGQGQILFEAACKAAQAYGVHGAATIKFLFDPASKEVFFLKIK